MWRIIRKRLKLLLSQKLILLLLFICCSLFTFLIYHNLSNGLERKGRISSINLDCDCEGWRRNFVASEEEKRIFQSVRMEHIHLMEKLEEASEKLDSINKQIPIHEAELKELQIRIEELKLLREEYSDRRNVQLKLPHEPMLPSKNARKKELSPKGPFNLLEESIDFSRCSISNLFRIFLYPLPENNIKLALIYYQEFLGQRAFITTNPDKACIFVAIVANYSDLKKQFSYFGPNGRNHMLLDLSGNLSPQLAGAAMLVSSSPVGFRPSMDIAAFSHVPSPDPDSWQTLPPLLPATRKYLLSFVAYPSDSFTQQQLNDMAKLEKSMDISQDSHMIDLECLSAKGPSCYSKEERNRIGKQSTFSLIFPEMPSFQERFYESLKSGSVPVICSLHAHLPFDEFVDWRVAVLRIPPSRFPELHFILRSISLADLLELKRRGRLLFEHLLADTRVLTRSILASIRFRLQMPGTEDPEPVTIPLYQSNRSDEWNYPSFISTAIRPPYDDEYLGPDEVPLESPQYTHNFTAFSLYSSQLWNQFPFITANSPRFLLNDHPLPSDAEFSEDTSFGMRPIVPGSGVEFSMALGGNRPREQFTIVLVSYNREQVLANTLEKLIGLPYLNRVIVVWNDVERLPSLPAWPRLHVPLLFVNGTRNSLNNRFIPYKEIQTEAVLSMDDDIDLKRYEIILAFRIWRENRDRIVGFPARYHARFGEDNFYNSNHTCQYSVILTGAAFLHKFFLSAYTFHMPAIIRQKVDEWMNCEDLAMNFLVSHLTRKPPIKTTSKWTLRCPTCEETLSNDQTHFNERHECIRFFTQVYGYNPLLFTQFRADSVLFKTRVPANQQKCFRNV